MDKPEREVTISIEVNGESHTATIPARRNLADFLREDLKLTGTHVGCEHGVCGACTVLVDGALARSCLMLAAVADGSKVTTVEGLADGDDLHPIQEAFREHHGLQCGFCTPGFLITSAKLIEENPAPTDEEIRDWLSGNICRCTGYKFIVNAVRAAAEAHRNNKQEVA